jgi:transaldolase/glucose-6-phosphate isomerase
VTSGTLSLQPDQRLAFELILRDWRNAGKMRRLWAKDATLWTGSDEAQWLGWLDIIPAQLEQVERFRKITHDGRGFEDAALLGMGGSSLCPEVLALSFEHLPGSPVLRVLDSTDPAQVLTFEGNLNLPHTLFIVASKSGSTLEPNIFKAYFFDRTGSDGAHFVAITDPGSHLQKVATQDRFRHVYFGVPSIGGRFSALSDFGMVPAAIMGIDAERFLNHAKEMADACGPESEDNPGLALGAFLGAMATHGRDKLTIISSPGIHDLGAWLEQLVAESTGKDGKGIIPVDREPLGPPEVYGSDRMFVYERLQSAPDPAQDRAVAALEAAGHPVMRIPVADAYHLGAEFFRWEIATAVAGSVIGINPFNQPDVEASKSATRKLTNEFERAGSLPSESPVFEDRGIRVFGDTKARTLEDCLRAHLGSLRAGDYFALLAYIEMNAAHEHALQAIRVQVRDTKRVATCVGFGPRFLHSTGQAYKGGPNTGVFLQITAEDARDVPVPGQKYTFGVVKAAQARGDLEVLAERGRRALRLHLGADVAAGLSTLASAVERAVK